MTTVEDIYRVYKDERDKIQLDISSFADNMKVKPNTELGVDDASLDRIGYLFEKLDSVNMMIKVIEDHLL